MTDSRTVQRSDDDWWREPGKGRYARPERERRFLLSGVPPDATGPRVIDDRYLLGTRLRLRRVTDGTATVYKLTQKIRPDPADGSLVMTTNTYLDADEYERLLALPAMALSKTRRRWRYDGHVLAVDEYAGGLTGLVLAEMDDDDGDGRSLTLTVPIVADVTADDRFSGGALAHANDAQRTDLLTWAQAMTG